MLDHRVGVHARLAPPTSAETWQARWATMTEEGWTGPVPPRRDAARTFACMDRAGIALRLFSAATRMRAGRTWGSQQRRAVPGPIGGPSFKHGTFEDPLPSRRPGQAGETPRQFGGRAASDQSALS